jgi:hypothetical protein
MLAVVAGLGRLATPMALGTAVTELPLPFPVLQSFTLVVAAEPPLVQLHAHRAEMVAVAKGPYGLTVEMEAAQQTRAAGAAAATSLATTVAATAALES